MDHSRLLREIWPLLRERLVEPLELIPHIRGLNDHDIESIRAAYYTNKMMAIDRLVDALRRRDRKCFYNFLVALREHEYPELAKEIMEIGGIQPEWLPRPLSNATQSLPGTRNQSALRVEPAPGPRVLVQEVSYSSVQTHNSEYTAKPFTPGPLTEETELRNVLDSIYDCWASELNKQHDKDQLWRKLGRKFCLTRQKTKELQAESSPGEALLDLITEIYPGFRVTDLLQLIQGECAFSDLNRKIRRDIGGYNDLDNNSPEEERGQDNIVEENTLPPRNNSTNSLQTNENTLLYSRSENYSSHQTSASPSKMTSSSKSVKFSDKNIPEKSPKSSTIGITLTGQYTSYNQEISGRKDEQLPPSVTPISVQSESSEVSSIIRRSQQEIQRENESKGRLIESRKNESKGISVESTGPTSREIQAFHHTSPKSSFLDDNLNDPEDLYKKNQSVSTKDVMGQSSEIGATHGLDAGVPNLTAESILSRSEENSRQTNLASTSQSSYVQKRGPIVHDEQSDPNEGGSSLTKAVKDLRKVLESETLENTSDIQRPQGNSMNIPVPSSGPIAQCDSCQEGSNKDLKELRETLDEVSHRGISDLRPRGNSVNIPVQTDGSTEEGNLIAAPDSAVSYGSNLFQSSPVESGSGGQGEGQTGGHPTTFPVPATDQSGPVESGSGGQGEGQTGSQPTTVPVPATDQSGAKNMEMEARELQHDIANQPSTQSYRDIQNSMPDQDLDGGNGQIVNSLVKRLNYDTEETSQNQTRDQSTPSDTQINISGTLQMSDSVSISGERNNAAGPNGNSDSSTADDDNAV